MSRIMLLTLREYLRQYSDYKIQFRIQDPEDEFNADYDDLQDFETGGYAYLLDQIRVKDVHTITIQPQVYTITIYYEQRGSRPKPKYILRCGNSFVNGSIIDDFEDDDEAISYAADYEATCYRIEPDGTQTIIYDPGKGEV